MRDYLVGPEMTAIRPASVCALQPGDVRDLPGHPLIRVGYQSIHALVLPAEDARDTLEAIERRHAVGLAEVTPTLYRWRLATFKLFAGRAE